tara:strand:- start:443 stop:700 length:258 start_codon:yes stop_codon:yes gene_type:complete
MSPHSPPRLAKSLALFGAIAFALEFFWSYVISDAALFALHEDLLQMYIFFYTGLNLTSFVAIVVQGALWGYVLGWILAKCLNRYK